MFKRSFPSISRLGIGAATGPMSVTSSSDYSGPVEKSSNNLLFIGLGVAVLGLVGWAVYSDYRNVQSLSQADRADLLKKRALYGFGAEVADDLTR